MQRRFKFAEGIGRPVEFKEELAEQFAGGSQRARSDDVLLGCVFLIRGGLKKSAGLLGRTLCKGEPGCDLLALNLNLIGPVEFFGLRENKPWAG